MLSPSFLGREREVEKPSHLTAADAPRGSGHYWELGYPPQIWPGTTPPPQDATMSQDNHLPTIFGGNTICPERSPYLPVLPEHTLPHVLVAPASAFPWSSPQPHAQTSAQETPSLLAGTHSCSEEAAVEPTWGSG